MAMTKKSQTRQLDSCKTVGRLVKCVDLVHQIFFLQEDSKTLS